MAEGATAWRGHAMVAAPPGWMVAAAVLTACAPQADQPLGPVPPGITVDLQESRYEIRGNTQEELARQMEMEGPGRPFLVQWRIEWDHRYNPTSQASLEPSSTTGGPCRTTRARLNLVFISVAPDWVTADDAPAPLRRRWATFMRAVGTHEAGHREIALDTARELLTALQDLETPSCMVMEREVRALAGKIIADGEERDRAYDAETESGRARGARWPG